MKHVLIISSDRVDQNMAGVGIRGWEIAHILAHDCKVTLAIPNLTELKSPTVEIVSYDWEHGDLTEVARQADVIIIQGFTLHFHPYLRDLGIPLAVDLNMPFLLESLVWHDHDDWSTWIPAYEEYLRVQLDLLLVGDFFFCASERQRDYWLGWLHAQKRINPHTYRDDPTLKRLIDILPFGLSDEPPPPHRQVLKGIHPGIPADSQLILWSSGLWDWLDPLTLIRAVAELSPRYPDLRLYFLGARHPNPTVSGMTMVDQAIALSRELGLMDRIVFFGPWVAYDERAYYLQEADLGVVTYQDHIETHFSFRTRILDLIWAGLPMIMSGGDPLADMVAEAGLGMSVPAVDVSGLSAAIETMLNKAGKAIPASAWEPLREAFRWSNVVKPLAAFCQEPRLAPDKGNYLTELERVSRGKDAFLQQVIQDKDAYFDRVVYEKDAFLERVVSAKDGYLQRVVNERDASYERNLKDQETEFERVKSKLAIERDQLQAELNSLEQTLPFRVHRLFKRPENKKIGTLMASVVIVNYNGKHFLGDCLNALQAQTYPRDCFEVIVSDNGSTDGSVEFLHTKYPWVRVLENERNLGFAGGNNAAFKAAQGKYLVLLNNDTAPLPDWLEKLIRAGEANHQAGIISGHSRLYYDQLTLKLESDTFNPGLSDNRDLGVMVAGVDSGVENGVVQYLQGFYGWEQMGSLCYRWTNGQAVLGVPAPPGQTSWTLKLRLSSAHPGNLPVHTRLISGDTVLGEWEIKGLTPQECDVVLPVEICQLAEPLIQNAGSLVDPDGFGKDRGTFAQNNEMFFEIDRAQYESGPVFSACGANMLIRREMLEKIGGFDDRFFMYYEDTDLAWRAWLKGWEVWYAKDAIIRHIHCGSSKEWSPLFRFYTGRNRLALLMKNAEFNRAINNWVHILLAEGKHTLGLIKAILGRNSARRAIFNRLILQYKILLSLFIWLPLLLWQRASIQRNHAAVPLKFNA